MPPRKKAKANTGKAVAAAERPSVDDVVENGAPVAGAASALANGKRKQPVASSRARADAKTAEKAAKQVDKAAKQVDKAAKQAEKVSKQAEKVSKQAEKVAKQAEKAAKQAEEAAEKPAKAAKPPARKTPASPIYDEVWKEVYLAGTEWDQIIGVYKVDWDFDHLDDELTDGDLMNKKVHLFGATEPQLIMMDEKDTKGSVVPVPVIVAVVSEIAPPATVGIKSIQRSVEEILPMSKLRMGWHAHVPDNVRSRRFKPNVHVLKCNERRARLRNMQEAAVHQYHYVLPYFIKPDQIEDVTEDTVVQVLADLEGIKAPLMCEFDFELDELAEFVEETINDNELDAEKHTEPLKTAIREAVKATKLKYKAEREERKRRIDAISQEERDAMKNMKLLKFYPANDWPNVSGIKSTFINRYYGHANEIL